MADKEYLIKSCANYSENRCEYCGLDLWFDDKPWCWLEPLPTESEEPHKENNVDHPSHYNREGAMETIDEMIELFGIEETMAFCKLNAWKYRSRAMLKNGEEDMKKSDWYVRKYAELKTKARMEWKYFGE